MIVGFVLEALGLAMASWGLWRTWRRNADDRAFWPRQVRRPFAWLRRQVLRRKTATVEPKANTARGGFQLGGTAFSTHALNADMTIDEKIEAVQANAMAARKAVVMAELQIREEASIRKRHIAELRQRIASVEVDAASYARQLVVDGVPQAILGLAAAALGLVLQGVASVATF